MIKRKIITMLLLLFIMPTALNSYVNAQNQSLEQNNKITDYKQYSDWAKYLEIKYQLGFYETEYSSHYPSFAKNAPTMSMRKWELANILYMINENEYRRYTYNKLQFKDETYITSEGPLSLTDEQLERINKLYFAGIIEGNKDGTFGTFDNVTIAEVLNWLKKGGFSSSQINKTGELNFSPDDEITVEQFLAILDIIIPDSIETIQRAFIETYTRSWPRFNNKCALYTEQELHALAIAADTSRTINPSEYYPYNSWAVDTGKKYKLIFLEDNARECTRSEIACVLYHLLGLADTNVSNRFNDLNDTESNLKTKINSMAAHNIISGYEDGSFKPNNSVTRAEFAAMLDRTRILEKQKNTAKKNFIDLESHWAKESIEKITSIGILSGKGNDMFCPDDGITPQEILVILDRVTGLNCITKDKLLTSMENTFNCKEYDDKERYIIEVVYSNFDQVQNDIKHRWLYDIAKIRPYKWEEWNQLATYNDLLYGFYLASTGDSNLSDNGIANFEKQILIDGINLGRTTDNAVNGLKDNMSFITWRDLLYALYTKSGCGSLDKFIHDDYSRVHFDELLFSNVVWMSDKDKAVLWGLSYDYTKILENNDMYFEMDSPVTKYMLNYMILKLQNVCRPFDNEFGNSSTTRKFFTDLSGTPRIELETDETKLPYNYAQYPYIVKGVPKEVYEFEGVRAYSDGDYQEGDDPYGPAKYYSPALCYTGFADEYSRLIENTYDFYNLILNVDYRSMDVERFVDQATTYAFTLEESAREYAQYVLDNRIILKGKGCAIPGTKSILGLIGNIRIMMEFEIIYANENKDLLYGDFYNGGQGEYHVPVVYANNKYFLYFDEQTSGSLMFSSSGKYEGVSNYRIMPNPIIRNVYIKDDTQNTLY